MKNNFNHADSINFTGGEELSLFFHFSLDPLCIAGFDGYLKKANKAFFDLLGYTEEELLTQPFLNFIHPDDVEATLRTIKELGVIGHTVNFENRFLKKGGDFCWLLWSANAVKDKQLMYSVGKDITERKRMEEELSLSKSILDSLTDAVVVCSLEGEVIYHNKAFTNQLGYNKEGINKLGGTNSLTENTALPKQIIDTVRAGKNWQGEIEVKRLNGDIKDYYVSIAGVYEEGNLVSKYAILSDNQERRAYERKLEVSYKKVNSILESIADGFIAVDRNWVITYWNKEAEKLLKKFRSEVIGKKLWESYPEDIDSEFYQQYLKAHTTKETVNFEAYLTALQVWLEVAAYPSDDGLSIYFRDITERKKSEEELKQMNERYQLVINATSSIIWDYDFKTNKVYRAGIGLKTLLGYDTTDHYGSLKSFEEHIHPEDKEVILSNIFQNIENNQETWVDQFRLMKYDRDIVYVQNRVFVLKNEDGNITRLIGSVEDITAQKIAENALIESEKNYKELFNNAPLPQFIYDISTLKFIQVNEAAVNIYGYSKEEFLQMTILDIRPKEGIERIKSCVKDILEHTKIAVSKWSHLKKSGEKIIVQVSSRTFTYKNRQVVLATINDLTEKLKLEERVTELKVLRQKRITQATIEGQEKERTELGRELHDNINQVLTTTKLFLDMAEQYDDMRLDLIKKSKDHIKNTINEIRSLSKSLIPPTLEDVGFYDTIQELVDTYLFAKKFHIELSFDDRLEELPKDLKITFFRVIQEQLNNITKYAEAQNVWIKFQVENTNINLLIADNGKGFDTSKKRHGIGLTNIKNRTEIYNGTFSISSSPGNGCSVRVNIPYNIAEKGRHPGSLSIFIAESNPEDQQLIKNAFAEVAPQHNLSFVRSSMEMINKLHSIEDNELPSLIVLEDNTTLQNGMTVMEAMEFDQRLKNVSKILYTTSIDKYNKIESLSVSTTAYIPKGITIEEIKDNVKHMLSFCD